MSSVLPKLYDKLMIGKLYDRLSLFIPTEQHGFVRARSTTSNLLETSQFISEEVSKGGQVDAV